MCVSLLGNIFMLKVWMGIRVPEGISFVIRLDILKVVIDINSIEEIFYYRVFEL